MRWDKPILVWRRFLYIRLLHPLSLFCALTLYCELYCRQLLTGEEIRQALENQGGEDVRVVPVRGRLDTIAELVVASGRSSRHLRKMAESIVSAVRRRPAESANVVAVCVHARWQSVCSLLCYS